MSAYYFHDGQNELGPFTVDDLKKQKLTRNTPVRQKDSDNWMPAEKLESLKDSVAPKKIRRPKDIIPAVQERFTDVKQKHPRVLYGSLLGIALLIGFSIFSSQKSVVKVLPAVVEKPQATQEIKVQEAKPEVLPEMKPEPPKSLKPPPVEDKAKAARLRWNKLITVTNSNYGIGLLGGIKDLKVIVTNRTDYPLDEVVAKVTYIKANGGIWKT